MRVKSGNGCYNDKKGGVPRDKGGKVSGRERKEVFE